MTKTKKVSAGERAESGIDAARRHLCQILGFDLAIIEFVNGDELVNVASVAADMKSEADEELAVLHDQNQQSLISANTALAIEVMHSKEPLVSRAFRKDHKEPSNEEDKNSGYPYIIVPMSFGGSQPSQPTSRLGLIRVVSFDSSKRISKHDLSTLKLTGEHLSNKLLQYGQFMGLKAPVADGEKQADKENILLIHSNRLVRRRFSRALSDLYSMPEASSSSQALEILSGQKVDLIFLDTALPITSRQAFCKQVKESKQWQHIPIVIVMTADDLDARVDGQSLGVDDYILETSPDQELLATVKTALRFCRAQQELARQAQLLDDYSHRLEEASEKLSTNEQDQLQQIKENRFIKAESEMLRHQEMLLHRISDKIRRSFNIEQNLQGILDEELSGYYYLDGCFITLPVTEQPEETIRCEYARHEDYKVIEYDLDLKAYETFKKHCRPDESLIVNKADSDPRLDPFKKEALARHQVLSLFYIPITYEEKLLGILCGFRCESEAQWNKDNETFFKSIADQIAIGVINARLYARVQRQATTDGLTGLLNHRTGQEKLSEKLKESERYQRNLAVMMIDVDHFKAINDTYGHPAGDAVLKAVAMLIQKNCRDVDLPIRYGGEEFLLILPEVNIGGASIVAERIRNNLSKETIVYDNSEIAVTASIGVAACPDHARSQQQLLDCADRALYMSKRMGRNQVHSASELNFDMDVADKPVAVAQSTALVAEVIKEKPELAVPPMPGPPPAETEKEELVPEVVETVKALATALYSKSEYNKLHHLETAKFSELLARVMGLSQKQIEQIRVAGLLHDVGTLSIPSELLNKEGRLTAEDREVINQHPVIGADLLRPISALGDICDILENHHEHWDGTGYPRGLKGEDIPLPARILSIVDSYHALISDRPYRRAMSEDQALAALKAGAGQQWDPFLVDIFISMVKNLRRDNQTAKAHIQGT